MKPHATLLLLLSLLRAPSLAGESLSPNAACSLSSLTWNYLGTTIEGDIHVIKKHGDDIYIGGNFQNAAGIPDADYLARWDGCEWHAVIPGLDALVSCIAFNGSTLYAGGLFTGRVGQLHNSSWTLLNGIDGDVLSLAANATGVYAGGWFENASGDPNADGVARWNGSAWVSMGIGIVPTDYVMAMAIIGNQVYVGGSFQDGGGIPEADGLVMWNGSVWEDVGTFSGYVTGLESFGADLYVCGSFTDLGGNQDADFIARWDGANWDNVGTDVYFDEFVAAMSVSAQYIYVSNTCWGGCGVQLFQYDIANDTWSIYPPGNWAKCMVQVNSNLILGNAACCGENAVWRWGEPDPQIHITGVPEEICRDADPISLPTVQDGYVGNWSGPGVSNNVFNPANQNNNVDLVFTPDPAQCVNAVSFVINVYLNYVNLNLPPSVCGIASPIYLPPYQGSYEGEWSGPGVSNNYFDPAGIHGFIFLTFTPDPGQCGAVSTDYISIVEPIIISISGIPENICSDQGPVELPDVQDGVPGIWSGPGVSNNTFEPSGLNGPITLEFAPQVNVCVPITPWVIDVTPYTAIVLTGVPDSLCQSGSPITLPGVQSNIPGTWSGEGVTNNVYDPAGLLGNIELAFTPAAGECASVVSTSITVHYYIVTIEDLPGSVCEDHPPVMLPAIQDGILGHWSGEGVSMNSFFPENLDGPYWLTFSPIPGVCASNGLHLIIVNPLSNVTISGIPDSVCNTVDPIALPEVQSGISGTWEGLGIANNIFYAYELDGPVELLFVPNENECALSADFIITVTSPVTITITGVTPVICNQAVPQILPTIQSGITGNWSGPGIVNNTLFPAGISDIISIMFLPEDGECVLSANWTIVVTDTVVPVLSGVPTSFCQADSPYIPDSVQNGFLGTWSGNGINGGIFHPASVAGEQIWTFIPNDECALSVMTTISVNVPVIPTLAGVPAQLCSDENFIILDIHQDGTTGHWQGPGISHDTFSPAQLNGNVLLSFIVDNGACEDTVHTQVIINSSPIADHPVVACDSTTNMYMVSFTIHGGDSTTYFVDGIPVAGSQFNSSPLSYTQSLFSFELTDANGCTPTIVSGVNPCACTSSAGSVMGNPTEPMRVCRRGSFETMHNGNVFLDPDDTLWYVLHDGTNTELGDILATSTNGMITPPSILLQGHVYYVTVLVGSTDSNGEIDFHDPCLSIAEGMPLVFVNCRPDETMKEPVDEPGNVDPFQDGGGTPRFVKQHDLSLHQDHPAHASMKLYTSSGILVCEGTTLPAMCESNLIPGFYVLHMTIANEAGMQQYVVSKMILIN